MKLKRLLCMISNEPGLEEFKGGWIRKDPIPEEKGFYKVWVTREQYEKMGCSGYDPWDLD